MKNYKEFLLNISDLADVLQIHQRTLRIYDKENILKSKRTNKNRRKYTYEDYKKGELICFLSKNLGINL